MRDDSTRVIEDWKGNTLVTGRVLRAIAERIVGAVHPEKIILFGSYAYGQPTLDSDIDLLVVMKNRVRSIENAIAVDKLFSDRRFGMDILVRTPEELENRLAIGDPFMSEITRRGKVLYERHGRIGSGLGRKGGNGLQERARPRAAAKRSTARQRRV